MVNKQPTFSYSRLSSYTSCGYAYDLKYNKKKFIGGDSIATDVGTLIHKILELQAQILQAGQKPNYEKLVEYMYDVNIPKKNPFDTEGGIYGIKVLRDKYLTEWFTPNEKSNLSYAQKMEKFAQSGIYRQEKFMEAHPELEIWDLEHPFVFEYKGEKIKGFIDRVLKYKGRQQYIVHDIKTRDRLFDEADTKTPLQLAIYQFALQAELGLTEPCSECYYDLPFVEEYQPAGSKGFLKRSMTKLDKIFDGIHNEVYEPHPSPLCYWCEYSNTNPHVTNEGRNQCPYYSLWTREEPSFAKKREWEGPEKVEAHLADLRGEYPSGNNKSKWDGFVL